MELAQAEAALQERVFARALAAGVVLRNPATLRIGPRVRFGPGAIVEPGTILEGRTMVGAGAVVGPHARVVDGVVPDGARLAGGELRGGAPA